VSEDEKADQAIDRYGCLVAIVILVVLVALGWWKVRGH